MTISRGRSFLLTVFTCFLFLVIAVWPDLVSANISVAPSSHNYGPVFANLSTSRQIFTISNISASSVSVTSISVTGSEATQFSVAPLSCSNLTPTLSAGSNCTVVALFSPTHAGTMNSSLDVRFDPGNNLQSSSLDGTGVMQNYALSLSVLGDGSGTVSSSPGTDISCSSGTCTAVYASGTTLTLTPSAASGSLLAGWSGCDSVINSVCSVTLKGAKNVSASFVRDISLFNYFWTAAGPNGGNITSLAISPNFTNDNTVFAGTAGGVFRSTNYGTTWSAVNSGLGSLKVLALALSPAYNNDRTLLAVTSAGLFKSTNNGSDWSKVGTGLDGVELTSVVFSPGYATDQTIFTGSTNGVFGSSDAGATWISLSAGLTNRNIHALAISPNYATSNMMLAATASGLFISSDWGNNWSAFGLEMKNVLSLAFSPNFSSDYTIFAGTVSGEIFRFFIDYYWVNVAPLQSTQPVQSIAVSPGYTTDHTVYVGTGYGIYRSFDYGNGNSWTFSAAVNTGNHSISAVALSPAFPVDQILFAGSQGNGVIVSNDRGALWSASNAGLSATQITSIAYSPAYSSDKTAFATASGGIYRTSNRGLNWSNLVDGIEAVDFKAVAVSPAFAADNNVFAGSNGGAYRSTNGGVNWALVKSGVSINSLALSPYFATDRTVYIASPSAAVYRSVDAGATWELLNSGLEGRTVNDISLSADGLFAATDAGVFLLNGASWQPVSPGKVTGGASTIHTVAVSPSYGDDRTVYAGTHGNGVIFSHDGGATWNSANNGLDNLDVQAIAFTPAFSANRTIFAATTGGGIFRSTSAGAQWFSFNNGLVTHDISALAVSPSYSSDSQALAGTNGSGVARLVIAQPEISLSPASLDFGNVAISGTSGSRTINIINSGIIDLKVSGIVIEGADKDHFNYSLGTCPSNSPLLVTGTSCTITVTFNPTSVGNKSASFTVSSDATSTPVQVVTLSAKAYDPPPVGSIAINNGATVTTLANVTLGLSAFDPNNNGSVTEMHFSNDSMAWSSWGLFSASADWVLSPLGGDGLKTVYVQFKDNAGNISNTYQASIELNSTLSVTTITAMPTGQYNQQNGFFAFTASKPSTFNCKIDGILETACTSPFNFTNLADASYTFHVTAKDSAGNQGPAASYTWTVDTMAPDTTIITKPNSLTNLTTASFTFTASEAGAIFQCKFDSGQWATCSSPYTLDAVSNGTHTFAVRSIDLAANTDQTPASFIWTVDTLPPVSAISGKPSNPTNLQSGSITFTGNETVAYFDCTFDGNPIIPACSSPFDFSQLPEGTHVFTVRGTDLAGNLESSAISYSWLVDITPPSAPIISSKPVTPTNSSFATFQFSSEPGATFKCKIKDTDALTTCTSPVTYSGLSEASHTFTVQASDAAGNISSTSYSWTIDITPPNVQITAQPPNPSDSIFATFEFTSNEQGSIFLYSLNGGAWVNCNSPLTLSGLANREHTLQVKAMDQAGNISTIAAGYSWTVNVPPVTQAVKLAVPAQPDNYYSSISASLDAFQTFSQVQGTAMLQNVNLVEDVNLNSCGKIVSIVGGYNSNFTSRTGQTYIYGSLTISCGTMIVDGLAIM